MSATEARDIDVFEVGVQGGLWTRDAELIVSMPPRFSQRVIEQADKGEVFVFDYATEAWRQCSLGWRHIFRGSGE